MFLDCILISLETNFLRELHSYVCRCPVELVLEWNILLHKSVLSFRLNEYMYYKGWATMKNMLKF